MRMYRIEAKNSSGKRLMLTREAENEAALSRALMREGVFPVKISPEESSQEKSRRGGVGRKMIEEFTSSVSMMLDSGMSFKDALSVQSKIASRAKIKELSLRFVSLVSRGTSFSDAVREQGAAFPPVYRALVRVGERTGTLDAVMKELSLYLEEERKIREKISNALIYPVIVLSTAIVGVIFMSIFMLPRMADLFSSVGNSTAGQVGGMASSLSLISTMLTVMIVVPVAAAIVLSLLRKKVPGLDSLLAALSLSVPVLGEFSVRREMLSFAFAMETLTGSSVPMEDSLKEAAGVIKNRALSEDILGIREAVTRGSKLSDAVGGSRFLPEVVRMWVSIGDETGQADKIFRQLKVYYRRETEAFSNKLMALAEPLVTLVVGIVMILMILGFIVPLFSMYGSALG